MLKKLITLLIGFLPLMLMAQPKKMLTFSFTLPSAATVSAGVYKGDVLIRTLFNNKKYDAGKHVESYEALDDDMNSINSTDGLRVKVLSNNVKYEWEGVIGNTSEEKSGAHIHRGFDPIYSIVINNNTAYYAKHYSEGSPAQNKFDLNNIQRKNRLFPDEPGGVGQGTNCIATDGKYVYWGGDDPFSVKHKGKAYSYVFATKTSDDSEVIFENGTEYKNAIGRNYKSTIDVVDDKLELISGLAVQKDGNFLFVAHEKSNELHVLNKITGKLIQSIPVNAVKGLAVDMKDKLWLITNTSAIKYSVNADGTLSNALITITGLDNPLATAVSPDNNTVVIADAGKSQQLKAYNNNSGTSLWNFGEKGGYFTSAKVADDKFYFSDLRKTYSASIAFEKDGSMWVVDGGNGRVQHYSPSRNFIERIMYLPHNYNMYVDPKVPTRLFAGYLEFAIDYSKPLAPNNGSWELVNNWGAAITDDMDNYYTTIRPVKLSNNKTYSLIRIRSESKFEVVELTATGVLRRTGVKFDGKTSLQLKADGALYKMPSRQVGKPMIFKNQPLTGFDNNNNPSWGAPQTVAGIEVADLHDPAYSGNQTTLRAGEKTSDNVVIVFDGSKSEGFHLGGIKAGDNKWMWRTAKATSKNYKGSFPADGSFDIGNGVKYPGGVALAIDRSIFWGYHGEFWKNSQTNKWNQFFDNGLMVGQFGITGPETKGTEAAPMMAGNVMAASVVKVGEFYYLYHNDEGHHSGIHRWKISGLNTIKEDIVPVAISEPKIGASKKSLMKGLASNKSLENKLDGWVRIPENDITIDRNRNWWSVQTNTKSYNKFDDPDIYIKFRQTTPFSAFLSKNLGPNNSKNWTLSGELNYDENFAELETVQPGDKSAGGQYFEVLDDKGKIIFRFFPLLNNTTKQIKLKANNVVIAQNDQRTIEKEISKFQPFTIKVSNGKLSFQYGSFAEKELPVFETSADLKSPATVRFYFWAESRGSNRVISFKNFDFDAE